MQARFDEYDRENRRQTLQEYALLWPDRIHNQRALQHVKEGFNRRVLMIDASLRQIRDAVERAGGPVLSPYAATDLAIHVNAFWLNICGALDNLAWALQYELTLVPGASEDGSKRQQVNLFDSSFTKALQPLAPALASSLAAHAEWHRDLRNLRDPAAHRIPVYPAPGVMTEQQASDAQRLHDEASALFSAGRHKEGMDLLYRTNTLGTYQPIMILSHDGHYEPRGIAQQVLDDDTHLAELGHAVLKWLFRAP